MRNPILQILNGKVKQNNTLSQIAKIKSMIQNPDQAFNELMNTNPMFRQFVNDSQGKTLEELAMEYDLDIDLLKKLM